MFDIQKSISNWHAYSEDLVPVHYYNDKATTEHCDEPVTTHEFRTVVYSYYQLGGYISDAGWPTVLGAVLFRLIRVIRSIFQLAPPVAIRFPPILIASL